MKILRVNLSIIFLVLVCLAPFTLFSQNEEEPQVEFKFKPPNEFTFEIKNISKYTMSMLLNREQAEEHSYITIYKAKYRSDRIIMETYMISRDRNNPIRMHLAPGEVHSVKFTDSYDDQFVKAVLQLKYGYHKGSSYISNGAYHKEFDLDELRRPGVLKLK